MQEIKTGTGNGPIGGRIGCRKRWRLARATLEMMIYFVKPYVGVDVVSVHVDADKTHSVTLNGGW